MTAPNIIKKEIQARYDQMGKGAAQGLKGMEGAHQLWPLVEGNRPALAYFRRRKIETALDLGAFSPGSTLLEVGCGTGDYAFLLARMGFKMQGADLSRGSIDAAGQKASMLGFRDMPFVVADAESLAGIGDASVDGVVSFSALRYVPDLKQALHAIHRVLKPGGVAVLDFPNRHCPWFRLLKTRFGVERHIHDQHYSTREIMTLMRAAGFTDVAATRILFTTYVLPAPLLPLFKAIDWIGERMPGVKQTAGIIMARGRKA